MEQRQVHLSVKDLIGIFFIFFITVEVEKKKKKLYMYQENKLKSSQCHFLINLLGILELYFHITFLGAKHGMMHYNCSGTSHMSLQCS